MAHGLSITLAHEMPGVGGQEARNGVAFASFFASDVTPVALLKAGIYSTIAVALKGGTWRQASLVMMAQTLAAHPVRNPLKEVNLIMPAPEPRNSASRVGWPKRPPP